MDLKLLEKHAETARTDKEVAALMGIDVNKLSYYRRTNQHIAKAFDAGRARRNTKASRVDRFDYTKLVKLAETVVSYSEVERLMGLKNGTLSSRLHYNEKVQAAWTKGRVAFYKNNPTMVNRKQSKFEKNIRDIALGLVVEKTESQTCELSTTAMIVLETIKLGHSTIAMIASVLDIEPFKVQIALNHLIGDKKVMKLDGEPFRYVLFTEPEPPKKVEPKLQPKIYREKPKTTPSERMGDTFAQIFNRQRLPARVDA